MFGFPLSLKDRVNGITASVENKSNSSSSVVRGLSIGAPPKVESVKRESAEAILVTMGVSVSFRWIWLGSGGALGECDVS